ncbi:RecX family transcriptional regulator [Candidatus Gottesmanbacteria bacterium]|nr:RecX family transcriptional regulator [Candidatus Gottesmanbacteria bacterium]
MQITALVFQKNNPKRVNLSVDGKFLVGMSAELAISLKLKVRMVLNSDQINDLVLNSLKEILLDSALYFLSVRPRSQKEVETRLKNKIAKIKLKTRDLNLDSQKCEKLISEVIIKLKNLGHINDEDFIKWWFRQRQEFRAKSLRAIKIELLQKGVAKKLIDEVLKDKDTSANELSMALDLLTKRLPRWQGLDKNAKKEKIYRFLLQRGFDYETIKTAIDTKVEKD